MDQEKIGAPLKGSNRSAPTSSFRLGRRNPGARDGKTKEGAERLRKAREIRKNIGEDYMGMHNEVTIDEDIHPYLNEIAERLWSTPSHAAIMIGAGFSKNANPNFPNWETLGDLFFEKIHGRKPNKEKGKDRYLNVLKLADKVAAAFGRPTLDQLLRDHIPDNDSEPSGLHTKMLELPWSDVFTTNYDTLLERARDSISSQKFDVVVNKEDLVHSERPRIIKLHGSFPSERPFIITEEDYRTYPKVFAPFVNTVQQSLLENTLCLIGFSGNDPNFLQWIGWIRDNLGKTNSPKIFLIGIFDLPDAQKKLFEQRNIVTVDLSKIVDLSRCPDVEAAHYKAIDRFFAYLLSRRKDESRPDVTVQPPPRHSGRECRNPGAMDGKTKEGAERLRLDWPEN